MLRLRGAEYVGRLERLLRSRGAVRELLLRLGATRPLLRVAGARLVRVVGAVRDCVRLVGTVARRLGAEARLETEGRVVPRVPMLRLPRSETDERRVVTALGVLYATPVLPQVGGQ